MCSPLSYSSAPCVHKVQLYTAIVSTEGRVVRRLVYKAHDLRNSSAEDGVVTGKRAERYGTQPLFSSRRYGTRHSKHLQNPWCVSL